MCRYHAHYELVVKLALDDVLSASVDIHVNALDDVLFTYVDIHVNALDDVMFTYVDIHVNALDDVYCLRLLTFT